MELPKTLAKFIWHFAKKHKMQLLTMQVCAFAWAFDNTVWPYIMQQMVDTIIHHSNDKATIWHHLTPILLLCVFAWLISELAFRAHGFISARVMPQFEADIRMTMFNYVQGHSYDYFGNHFSGSISNRISDMTQSASHILLLFIQLFIPAALALVITFVMFMNISHWFALVLMIWIIFHMGISLLGVPYCTKTSHEHSESRSTLNGKIVDAFSNILNVKMFARKQFELAYLNRYQQAEQRNNVRALNAAEFVKVGLGLSSIIFPGLVMTWYIIYSWQQNYISVGEVVLIFNILWNIQHLAWFVGLELPHLYQEIGICQQALSLIQAPHDINDKLHAKPIQFKQGLVEFDQVHFNYRNGKDVFTDFSVRIEAGSKVGLVGFSGSGKTTFVNLLMRLYDINGGEIRIDGHNIQSCTIDALRSQISMIPQDPSLFHRTLIENIRYGKIDATDEEVYAAAKHAHCEEFIAQMPLGYDTLVGERGIKLSGGQRQRIAIARALLENAPILVLDEATSALDSVTEKQIQDALHYIMEGRTTVVVAHRLSTLSEMDRILVFHNGRIIEDGTHEELLRNDGHYAKMWTMQAGGFLPDKPD